MDATKREFDALIEEESAAYRQTVLDFVSHCLQSIDIHAEEALSLIRYMLDRLQTRAVAFEEPIALLREKWAEVHERRDEWNEAAQVLAAIPLEHCHRTVSADYKAKIYIHIVRLYLEVEDSIQAEAYLNRAASIMPDVQDALLQLTFKVCQTKILDYKRKFMEAAHKYHELSMSLMDSGEQAHALSQAVICSILSAAGPARVRLLELLFKDERVDRLCAPIIKHILQQVYLGRLLKLDDVQKFSHLLQPHHLARLGDGSTVLDRAMVEHNLLAIAAAHEKLTLKELASALGITEDKAEEYASSMLVEKRMLGYIDQVEGCLYFDHRHPGHQWDQNIANFLRKVNELTEHIEIK